MMTVRDVHKQWGAYMKSFALEAGLPDAYPMVMAFLLRHPGASLKDIAAHRNTTTASASLLIREMQRDGYLRRESDPQDQRYVRLYLTEKGEACAASVRNRIHRADAALTDLLTPEREQTLISMLTELEEIIEKELPKC